MNYIGIDCDTKQISMVLLNENGAFSQYYSLNYEHIKDAEERFKYLVEGFEQFKHIYSSPDGSYFTSCRPKPVVLISIEDSIYIQNPKTSMNIAKVTGYLMSVAIREGIPFKLVDNRVWKKAVLGNGNATKEESIEYAHLTFKQKWNEHVADAACIALWGIKYGKETIGCR